LVARRSKRAAPKGWVAEALIEFVYGRAEHFAGGVEQDDDQTMVVLAVDA